MSWMKDDKAIQDMVARRNPLNDESTRQLNETITKDRLKRNSPYILGLGILIYFEFFKKK